MDRSLQLRMMDMDAGIPSVTTGRGIIGPMKTFTAIHGNIPVLLHVPHSGLEGFHDASDIDAGIICREMTTLADIDTDWIARLAAERFDGEPYLLRSEMTRMECDVERYPDSREEMNSVGMGVIYSKGINGDRLYTSDPSQGVVDNRMGGLYIPYHASFRDMTSEIVEKFGFAIILDIHSYSRRPLGYELHKDGERPQICVGTNGHDDTRLMRGILSGCRWSTAFNGAFSGSITPQGMDDDPKVHSVMLEIRKDTYLDDDGDGLRPGYADMSALGAFIAHTGMMLIDRIDSGMTA